MNNDRMEATVHVEIKTHDVEMTEETRQQLDRKLAKISRQVSPLARLELDLSNAREGAAGERVVVDAALHLKRVTLRTKEASPQVRTCLNRVVTDLARQVKRDRDKRRRRREQRSDRDTAGPFPATG